MSIVGKEYKREIDELCADDINISAEDILRKAESFEVTPLPPESTDVKAAKGSRARAKITGIMRPMAGIAAALILVTCLSGIVAGAMGYGPLAKPLRDIFKEDLNDDISATIVDEGFFEQVGTTHHSGRFDITFVGFTGDTDHPMLMFVIKTDDEDFCAKNKEFGVTVYNAIEEENYDKKRIDLFDELPDDDFYGFETTMAVQDANDPHLYYASVMGARSNMVNNTRFVVAVRSIRLGCKVVDYVMSFDEEIMLDAEWRMSLPDYNSAFKEAINLYPGFGLPEENRFFDSELGYTYELRMAEFGYYNTSLRFGFDWTEGADAFNDKEDVINADYHKVLNGSALIVDGVEYKYTMTYILYLDENDNRCYVSCEFPPVDYNNAKSIEYVYGNTRIVLK